MSAVEHVTNALTDRLGPSFSAAAEDITAIWRQEGVEVALHSVESSDQRLRQVWNARHGGGATPLVLVAPRNGKLAVLGPLDARGPIREVEVDLLVEVVSRLSGLGRRQAAATLAAELERIDEAGIPGIVIRGLLTRHVLERRLRRSAHWSKLEALAKKIRRGRAWRDNFTALGYAIESRTRGYLLRANGSPVAIIHPFADTTAFGRTTPEGSLPEGVVISDCASAGAAWGVLATDDRFRLYKADSDVGAATGRYLEFDFSTTQNDDWPLLGLLAPESLDRGGILDQLLEDAVRFGTELRDQVEVRLREQALPAIARGLGTYRQTEGADLADPDVRHEIEGAAFALLFRMIFLLYAEARGYLPLSSAAYRPHAATTLVADARTQTLDHHASALWDRMMLLVRSMRTGNAGWGLPAYDGDLFAAAGVWGAELLERATMPDEHFGFALAAIGFEEDEAEGGIDYADLEIAHIGRIYEGLLALRLSLATEDLAYDSSRDRFVPGSAQPAEVAKGELFWQTQSGGRKAAGVYYTQQLFVRHLINQSVVPSLEEHLEHVADTATDDPQAAARRLFEFYVVDPAMGSAHFLADALDVIADMIQTWLAENPLPEIHEALDAMRREIRYEAVEVVEDGDLLRRLVLKHCIYGVDLSEMAVEVGKMTLWLASFVPGLSLAYLGHNLRRGNSLVGVADEGPFLETLGPLFSLEGSPIPEALNRAKKAAAKLASIGDRTPEEVAASRAAAAELDEAVKGLEYAYGLWCAELFGMEGARQALIAGSIDELLAQAPPPSLKDLLDEVRVIADKQVFFHWTTAFPEVFSREQPGFDAVIGNPPWEEVNIEELGFFALHDPGLRGVASEAARRERIARLIERFPDLPDEFDRRRMDLREQRSFFSPAGGYFHQGAGNLDLYELFCERYQALTRDSGFLAVVLPRSAFLGKGSTKFRQWLLLRSSVRRIDFLLNAARWAFDMEPRYTIALLAARRVLPEEEHSFSITGPSASRDTFISAAGTPGVSISLARLKNWTSPKRSEDGISTMEVPLVPSDRATELFEKLRAGPRFDEGYEGIWEAFPVQGDFNETTHKKYFKHESGREVWKGASFRDYDPHGATVAGYAQIKEAKTFLQGRRRRGSSGTVNQAQAFSKARVAFHDVTRSTDSRTMIAALVPPDTFLTNTAPYLVFPVGDETQQALVLGVFNSVPFDWQCRRFVETHMNFFVLNLQRFPSAEHVPVKEIATRAARLSCVDDRFAEFAGALGTDYGPLAGEDRLMLRAEIDALVGRAYGLDESDWEVVFADFSQTAVPDGYQHLVLDAWRRLASEEGLR